MKYWTICYPGEVGQHVRETFSEEQIIKSYYRHWMHVMVEANKHEFISEENCIEDWKTIHWAEETDEWGNRGAAGVGG
jgi:2-succinyl-5-enolpyruvyl-6-hydroxy-3-cyclohexene-1-carboxylate synthase